MKALFLVSYDHYRWQDFLCASDDERKLEDYAKSKGGFLKVIHGERESFKLDSKEENHFLIDDIDVI